MPKKPRVPGSSVRLPVPADVKTAVADWEERHQLKVFSQSTTGQTAYLEPARQAIAILSSRGCTAADIADVLELLWRYGQTEQFNMAKSKREGRLNQATNAILRLRRLARDVERIARLLNITRSTISAPKAAPTPTSFSAQLPSQTNAGDSEEYSGSQSPSALLDVEAVSNDDSDKNSSPQAKPPIAEMDSDAEQFRFLKGEPQIWDSMRNWADGLEGFVALKRQQEFSSTGPFSRGFGGPLVWLVFATALINYQTSKPHYREIASILGALYPQLKPEQLSEGGIEKKITRFRTRRKQFLSEVASQYEKHVLLQESLRAWLENVEQ